MRRISETTKGIICLVTSAFCFAMMAVCVKLAGDSIHFMQKAFFRNSVAFIIALVLLIREGVTKGKDALAVPKACWFYLILRSVTGSFGIFGNFYAIDRICLADAAILNKMAPFFAVIFSYFLIKEKIKPIPFVAIMIAFCGAMLVVKPSFNFTETLPTMAGFIGGMGAGFAYACVRKLSSLKCNSKVIVLFFSAFSMIISLPYMITSFNPMTWWQVLVLCGAGVCAAGGQFGITAAYYHAAPRDISIYDYSQLIFSTLLGFFFFGQIPDKYSFIGYFIIISMAILNFIWNKKHHEAQ